MASLKKLWKAKLDGRRWSINKIESEILKSRDIFNLDRFLYPVEEDMLPLNSLKNIKEAAEIVINAINNNEKILVYYDTDTDGITSGTIINRYLSHFVDKNLLTQYINDGKIHGLTSSAPCFNEKYDVIIIVDSIQTEPAMYQMLLDIGSKIVVLDHHNITMPVLAMQKKIHLVSSMNDYQNPHLCGAGVALKFCLYLDQILNVDYANEYYDLAACGICADMMNVGFESMENRYICYRGFGNLQNKAIKYIKGSYEMTSTTVSYSIAPLINAANRMGKNWAALKLFLSNEDDEIIGCINELKGCREKQNQIVEQVYTQIEKQAKEQENKKMMFFIIEDAENVSGLIANRVLGQYQRPVVITQERVDQTTGEEQYSGSLRAVGVDDFSKMVNKTRYAKAMGHSNAAGFVVSKKNKDKFINKIEEQLADKEFEQRVIVDIQLSQRQINKELIAWLKQLNRISGVGFPPITVMIEDVTDYEVGNMSSGKHTKITTPYMLFIKWNCEDWEFIPDDGCFGAYGTLDQGFFGKTFNYRMIMEDYKVDELLDLDEIFNKLTK